MSDLYKQLEKNRDSDYYPFHMPGHKRNFLEECGGALEAAYGIDITEIDGFDNLHQAQGILQQAQHEAAELYGAEETFFLVNGSTCGILSAIAAATKKGDRLLMARNCHGSVYHAVYLQELKVSYLYPDLIREYGIADAVSPEQVEGELKKQADIAAVMLTSPTYEGVVADVAKIADIVHRYGKILIVDEAHGAHFGFHEAFPENSVRQGADIVIHSVHKTLPSMTQTALLHVQGSRVDRERLRRYLQIFQTSSPSYVLMASMDTCMNFMREKGWKYLDYLVKYRRLLDERVSECRHLRLAHFLADSGYCMKAMEPGKIVITLKNRAMTGQQLYEILRENYHLQLEMAADSYVMGIATLMDTAEGMDRLAAALLEIDREIDRYAKGDGISGDEQGIGYRQPIRAEIRMTIAEALALTDKNGSRSVPLSEAAGETSAGYINLYPPGIPLIVPGECFHRELIRDIKNYLGIGLNVQGVSDYYVKII